MGLGEALIALPLPQKRALAVLFLFGGSYGGRNLAKQVKRAQREQVKLCESLDVGLPRKLGLGAPQKPRVAVDALFGDRLLRILRICVPGIWSREMALIVAQGCLLVSRTWLTDYISRIEALAGRHLISQEFPRFLRLLAGFAGVAIPAALVNAGLKYCQKLIQLAFMRRLTHHLHNHYTSNRAYFAASTLRGLTGADQRITEDVEKFSAAIADLYGYTFKPLLDVLLFTRSLSRIMGYKGQMALYAYYMVVAYGLRTMSPPLALMTSQEAGLTGAFRSAHQRLVTYSEEVAFNDPPGGAAEQMVLNQHLHRLLKHSSLSAFQRFVQGTFDQYFVKYSASVVAMLVYAAPLWSEAPGSHGSRDDITQNYIRAMRLLQNTSRGIGDLVLVGKRVAALAGHTSRVSELLEEVQKMSEDDGGAYHRALYALNVSSSLNLAGEEMPEPVRLVGDVIRFNRVALNAPDGRRLVRELSFDVPEGHSVMIMGPNGSGKSSLFRVLAGLWPLLGGEITMPSKDSLFYLSQKPYLVTGSLRDQLIYPGTPAAVWAEASPAAKARFVALEGPGARQPTLIDTEEQDLRMTNALEAVGLHRLLERGNGRWDNPNIKWIESLSGGERQLLVMARLLFHRPRYAILDECTSAMTPDAETLAYEAVLASGITMLSIAHRPVLRRFHQVAIHFEGNQTGDGWHIEQLQPPTKTSSGSQK